MSGNSNLKPTPYGPAGKARGMATLFQANQERKNNKELSLGGREAKHGSMACEARYAKVHFSSL
jgi:hypothetical protein